MKVTVAGNVKDIKEGTTIAQLVIDEKVENPEYVTVTVNDEFVENHDLANVTLKENTKTTTNKKETQEIKPSVKE